MAEPGKHRRAAPAARFRPSRSRVTTYAGRRVRTEKYDAQPPRLGWNSSAGGRGAAPAPARREAAPTWQAQRPTGPNADQSRPSAWQAQRRTPQADIPGAGIPRAGKPGAIIPEAGTPHPGITDAALAPRSWQARLPGLEAGRPAHEPHRRPAFETGRRMAARADQPTSPSGTVQGDRAAQASPGESRRDHRGASRAGRRRATRSSKSASSATRLSGRAARPVGGKRKKPGGHRKPAAKFPTVPAVAGVATLVATATGAMTMQSTASGTSPTGDSQQGAPAGIALTVSQLHEARSAAASRADRSRRDDAEARARAEAAAREAEKQRRLAAAERAVWEAERTRELRLIEKSAQDATKEQTFERVIQWYLPLRSFRLSAYFGADGSMWSSRHTGLDFAAPLGSPVRAIGDGEIIEAGYDGSYGNKIVVRHPDGTETWYCHLSGYERRSGYIAAGTTIGYVGSTGNSSGPHLHLEVRPGGGDPIDPLSWLRQLGLPI